MPSSQGRAVLRMHAIVRSMLGLLLCFFMSSAMAHSRLVNSQPEQGAKLTQAPSEATLEFNAPVEPAFSRMEIFQQQWQALKNIQVQGKTMRVALPPLPPGEHQVRWSIMSPDGHQQTGILRFRIQP